MPIPAIPLDFDLWCSNTPNIWAKSQSKLQLRKTELQSPCVLRNYCKYQQKLFFPRLIVSTKVDWSFLQSLFSVSHPISFPSHRPHFWAIFWNLSFSTVLLAHTQTKRRKHACAKKGDVVHRASFWCFSPGTNPWFGWSCPTVWFKPLYRENKGREWIVLNIFMRNQMRYLASNYAPKTSLRWCALNFEWSCCIQNS